MLNTFKNSCRPLGVGEVGVASIAVALKVKVQSIYSTP